MIHITKSENEKVNTIESKTYKEKISRIAGSYVFPDNTQGAEGTELPVSNTTDILKDDKPAEKTAEEKNTNDMSVI